VTHVSKSTTSISARRLLVAGCFAAAVAAAPAVATLTFAPAAGPSVLACPNGESTDIYTGECIPDLVPNSPTVPQGVGVDSNGFPTVDGVPCTGHDSGQCIGLEQEQQAEGPAAVPHSSVNGVSVGG
jgi:hypothetical protein